MIASLSQIIQRYIPDLFHFYMEPFTPPVPLILCLIVAAIVVIASYILLVFFKKKSEIYTDYPKFNLQQWKITNHFIESKIIFLIQIISVFLFIIIILAGYIGDSNPIYNISPTFVWVIWWVGIAYTSAFLGNIWSLLNPWKIIFTWIELLFLKFSNRKTPAPLFQYPHKIGVWPSFFLFLIFAWIENVYHDAVIPLRISQLIVIYSMITWGGMILFGKNTWLRYGETFTIVFGFFAKFAPIQSRVSKKSTKNTITKSKQINLKEIYLCIFGSELLNIKKISISETLLVILLLATVTFDGFTGTLIWINFQNYITQFIPNIMLINTIGLLFSVLIFIGVYFYICVLMMLASGNNLKTTDIAKSFIYTLIPIALAYHIAHFLLFLLIQGQLIFALISDPFGFNWNLFGTTNYKINFMLVSSNFYWITSVISILIGHIIAVFLSHTIALRLIKSHKYAIRSQYPMLILMVGYTIASLWIITQPMYN